MGACSIVVTGHGKNMQDAYQSLVREAKDEHGSDAYNGEINNCELAGDLTHKRSDYKSESIFLDYIIDKADKREVYGFCIKKPIANKNQIKTVVTNYPQKGARKFETRYVAYDAWIYDGDPYACGISEKTQGAAITAAREYVARNPNTTLKIKVIKQLVNGEEICAEVKYKKASTEKLGTYTFAGWAPS
jgi:hypothetical protein